MEEVVLYLQAGWRRTWSGEVTPEEVDGIGAEDAVRAEGW